VDELQWFGTAQSLSSSQVDPIAPPLPDAVVCFAQVPFEQKSLMTHVSVDEQLAPSATVAPQTPHL
jgi:hypothetical protein